MSGREGGAVEGGQHRAAGLNSTAWAGRDPQGRPLPPGVYLVAVTAMDEEGRQASAVRTVRMP